MGDSPLFMGILGVISGAILVAFIHCIFVSCRNHNTEEPVTLPPRTLDRHRPPRVMIDRESNTSSSSFPTTSTTSSSSGSSILLTVHKYTKEFKEGTCAVCLGEFEENEEVRIMPECAHVFHMTCIDMWLFSHGNCPLCRANATPHPHDVLLSILNSRNAE